MERNGWFGFDDATGTVRRRRLRSGGFRSSDLNALGWTAALGPGAVAGALTAWLTPLPTPPAVIGGVGASWLVALALDRVAWNRIPFGVSDERLTWSQAAAVVAELRSDDRDVVIAAHRHGGADRSGEAGEPPWTIRSTNRHHRAVMAAIERAASGTDGPRRPDGPSRPDGPGRPA